jgi:hypothetical protein
MPNAYPYPHRRLATKIALHVVKELSFGFVVNSNLDNDIWVRMTVGLEFQPCGGRMPNVGTSDLEGGIGMGFISIVTLHIYNHD